MINRAKLKGFSLVELAIVLGVIGVVLGGVWIVVNQVMETVKQEQLSEQIFLIVKNVRTLYQNQVGISGTLTELPNQLVSQNAIPREMIRNYNGAAPYYLDHPWGPTAQDGNLLATGGVLMGANNGVALGSGNSDQQFRIELRGLSQKSCIGILFKETATNAPTGMTDLLVNGNDIYGALPLMAAGAATACATSLVASGAVIDLVYRLRAPQN